MPTSKKRARAHGSGAPRAVVGTNLADLAGEKKGVPRLACGRQGGCTGVRRCMQHAPPLAGGSLANGGSQREFCSPPRTALAASVICHTAHGVFPMAVCAVHHGHAGGLGNGRRPHGGVGSSPGSSRWPGLWSIVTQVAWAVIHRNTSGLGVVLWRRR
eukprot:320083-Chlamydomonas_euryale.AAC.10